MKIPDIIVPPGAVGQFSADREQEHLGSLRTGKLAAGLDQHKRQRSLPGPVKSPVASSHLVIVLLAWFEIKPLSSDWVSDTSSKGSFPENQGRRGALTS